jgi:hypothetical protein
MQYTLITCRLALSPYRQKALKGMFSGYIVYGVRRIGRQLPYFGPPFAIGGFLVFEAHFEASHGRGPRLVHLPSNSLLIMLSLPQDMRHIRGPKRRTTTITPRLVTSLLCMPLENMEITINQYSSSAMGFRTYF